MARPTSDTAVIALRAMLTAIMLTAVVLVAVVLIPVSVRHSAPFGSVQTVDFDRSIAVLGGEVQPNYSRFDRIDLDLRAYGDRVPEGQYDFVLSIQTVEEPVIIRQVAFSVAADRIPATRSAFSPVSTTVEFDAIPDSAGRAYYVSLERGPRNADDIVTLWGIRTYSTVPASDVVLAAVDGYQLGFSAETDRVLILAAGFLTVLTGSVAVATVMSAVWQSRQAAGTSSLPRPGAS